MPDNTYISLARIVYEAMQTRDRKFEEQLIMNWYLHRFPKSKMPRFSQVTPFALIVAIAQELNHHAHTRSPGAHAPG